MAHLGRTACRAHRQEMRAERKEARLHTRAVNQAMRGNFGKAAVLESRAHNQHHRAEHAHMRAQAAATAMIMHPHHPHCGPVHRPLYPPGRHHHGPHTTVIIQGAPPPPPQPAGVSYTTVTQTYPQPAYPTGNIPPPAQAPPAGSYAKNGVPSYPQAPQASNPALNYGAPPPYPGPPAYPATNPGPPAYPPTNPGYGFKN